MTSLTCLLQHGTERTAGCVLFVQRKHTANNSGITHVTYQVLDVRPISGLWHWQCLLTQCHYPLLDEPLDTIYNFYGAVFLMFNLNKANNPTKATLNQSKIHLV